jgi:hypothetical protein
MRFRYYDRGGNEIYEKMDIPAEKRRRKRERFGCAVEL